MSRDTNATHLGTLPRHNKRADVTSPLEHNIRIFNSTNLQFLKQGGVRPVAAAGYNFINGFHAQRGRTVFVQNRNFDANEAVFRKLKRVDAATADMRDACPKMREIRLKC